MNDMKNIWKYILIAIPVILGITALVFFLLKLPTQEKQGKYTELITQGNTQLEQKEYAKALNSFNEAAAIIDTKQDAYEGITNVLVIKNQLGQLVEVLDKATGKLDNESKSILYTKLAQGYLDSQNVEQSLVYFQKAVDFSYSNEFAKLGLAKSYLIKGDLTNGVKYLDIPSNSTNYEENYVLKLICQSNNLTEIKKVLEETITVSNPVLKKNLDDFKVVAKVNPTETLYMNALLSRIYVNMGFNNLAISLFERETNENLMEYGDYVYVVAAAQYNIGNYQVTVDLLKEYVNSNSDPDVYLLQARSNAQLGEDITAVKHYESAVLSSGDKSEPVYEEYIKYLLNEAQYEKTKETLDKADKKYNENWIDIAYLRMYYEQKNNAKAQFYIDRLSKVSNLTEPEKKDMYYWIISQYIDTQKTSDATILLAKYLELDRYNPKYYLLAGKLHLQLANTSEAKKELEQAIDLDLTGEITESAKKLLSRVN